MNFKNCQNPRLLLFNIFICFPLFAFSQTYSWLETYDSTQALLHRISPPEGFLRIQTQPNSFGEWLQHFPLKPGKGQVLLHYGIEKRNQDIHVAVLDIDVGKNNLQQGANAVIRLRGEYLYSIQEYSRLHFNFKTGDRVGFSNWIQGYRPIMNKESVLWVQSGDNGASYRNFKAYITQIFVYAGPNALYEETLPVLNSADMQAGDVFIQTQHLGSHAVIVMDMAENPQSGQKVFLIAQSYIPAQDLHILINPLDATLSPWYSLDFGDSLVTPEWTFSKSNLKRF
jgi:hypothetical protein